MQEEFDSSCCVMSKYRDSRHLFDLSTSFFKQARRYLGEMQHAQETSQRIYTLFDGIEDSWQYHCDVALTALTALQEPVYAFCNLLSQSPDFPIAISLQWYQLVVALYQLRSQGHDLTLLLTTYRSHCHLFSKHIFRQREEIYFKLKALFRNSDECLQQITHLLDEVQFLARQNSFFYDLEEEGHLVDEKSWKKQNLSITLLPIK